MLGFSLIAASLRISVPYAAGALGGAMTERSGTVNIAIEGFMLTGAFAFACGSYYGQTAWLPALSQVHPWIPLLLGVCLAVTSAMALSLFHAAATLIFRADHIVSGLAVNFLAWGLTDFLLQKLFGSASNSPSVPVFRSWLPFPKGSWLNLGGMCHPVILIVAVLLVMGHLLLYYTRLGMRLRASGENPEAALAAGIRPRIYRLYGILLGAGIASIGGVWLVSEQGLFSSNMTAGRGYIALAVMILGRWKPLLIGLVCLFFGFVEAMQNHLQVSGVTGTSAEASTLERLLNSVPTQAIQALPYIATLLIVAGLIGRSRPPAALGQSPREN